MRKTHPLPDTARAYAGLVSRLAVVGIDGAIVAAVLAVGTGATVWIANTIFGATPTVVKLGLAAFAAAWPVGYFTVSWSTTGRTIGEGLLGVMVLDRRGRRPRFGRSLLRALFGLMFAAVWLPGLLLVLFDRHRRALHDRAFGTVVVYRTEVAAAPT